MKRTLTTLLLTVLFAGFSASTALAQGKIGFVKLRSLFDGYYKTKLADAKIKERAGELDKDMEDLTNRYKALEQEQKDAAQGAEDLAASKEERDRRRAVAEAKLIDMKQLEAEIVKYRRQAEVTLREQQTRMRSRVLDEIQAEIDAQAKAGGYFLIINKDAEDRNETKLIMFHSGENDLTESVLGRLNAGAPATLEAVSEPKP
ncbi:MAG TPA: hypothetical protein DCY13_20415 [Verrucomicrobiales bacterium]|nr:hypothetical protein [Verrucomicrobiales bacterium]